MERIGRCSVWQVTQFRREPFCSCVPGTLSIHSALVSLHGEVGRLAEFQIRRGALLRADINIGGLKVEPAPVAAGLSRS